MAVPGWLPEYSALASSAAVGSLMRGRAWFDRSTGRFSAQVFIAELATAVGLAIAIGAFGEWQHWDLRLTAAIAVGAGWLGPLAASKLMASKLGIKLPDEEAKP